MMGSMICFEFGYFKRGYINNTPPDLVINNITDIQIMPKKKKLKKKKKKQFDPPVYQIP
jgi:hypothetical protein